MPLSAIHIYIRDLDRRVIYEQGWLLLRTINSILHGVRRGMASVAEIPTSNTIKRGLLSCLSGCIAAATCIGHVHL